MKVVMPYIGQALSVNSYRVRIGRRLTTRIRPEVKLWMGQLAEKVKGVETDGNLTGELFGKFIDGRVPDLPNLHKVIGDALKEGLGVDDRDFKFVDLGYDTGYDRPVLEINLEGA